MKQISRIISIAVLLFSLSAIVQAGQLDGITVIRKMFHAAGTVTYTGTEVTRIAGNASLRSRQLIQRAGFRGMREEYIDPSAFRGEVIADDSRVSSHYIPGDKVLILRPSRLAAMRTRMRQLPRAGLKARLLGTDKVAGRKAYIVKVNARSGNGATRKLWIDAEKWVKLKTEDISANGTVVSSSYLTDIKFVKSIPADHFKIARRPGVRVVRDDARRSAMSIAQAQHKVNFHILLPAYLPAGFKSAGVMVKPFRGGNIVAIRYTDGVNSFSLFQSPGSILNRPFHDRLRHNPCRLGVDDYTWQRGDLTLTIIGRLPSNQVRQIAKSVK